MRRLGSLAAGVLLFLLAAGPQADAATSRAPEIVLPAASQVRVAVDSRGTSYVISHAPDGADHYCRLPAKATRCDVSLSFVHPHLGGINYPSFVILGTHGRVTLVIPTCCNVEDVTQARTSVDGGKTFGPPAGLGKDLEIQAVTKLRDGRLVMLRGGLDTTVTVVSPDGGIPTSVELDRDEMARDIVTMPDGSLLAVSQGIRRGRDGATWRLRQWRFGHGSPTDAADWRTVATGNGISARVVSGASGTALLYVDQDRDFTLVSRTLAGPAGGKLGAPVTIARHIDQNSFAVAEDHTGHLRAVWQKRFALFTARSAGAASWTPPRSLGRVDRARQIENYSVGNGGAGVVSLSAIGTTSHGELFRTPA